MGDIRICGDNKIGVNHRMCSDSFPLPTIETASHELPNMKHLAKIDLKSARPDQNRRQIFKNYHTEHTHGIIEMVLLAVCN